MKVEYLQLYHAQKNTPLSSLGEHACFAMMNAKSSKTLGELSYLT